MPETKTRKPKEGHTTLFLREVPVDVKKQFKAACARAGMSMNDAIVRFMSATKEAK